MADDRARALWDEFASASGVEATFTAWAFGSDVDPDQQTELGRLVLEGPKRATAGLLADYEEEGEPFPEVGDYSVILDGTGEPLCIIRITAVDVRRLEDGDEDFAWTEGEGDRTLGWWRSAHEAFWAREGHLVSDDSEVVLERFDLVWPAVA